jgi:hypothetical protein
MNYLDKLAPYRKTVASLITGLLGWGSIVVASNRAGISAEEWLTLGVVLATSLGVYSVTNEKNYDGR